MKALMLGKPGGIEQLKRVDLADPGTPGDDEIRVRLQACSLNYHDCCVINGIIPAADGRIPLSDGAGVVEDVGKGVTDFKIGDNVVSCFFPYWQHGPPTTGDFSSVPGDGVDGYAREIVVRPASWFTRAPQGFSHVESATLVTAGLTAWRALNSENTLRSGETVLILGTGGVSIFALQFAKLCGAVVIATTSSDEKRERLRELGADCTINYRTEPDWGEAVLHWTKGRGVDYVVEVGGPGTLPQSIKAVRVGGRIMLIGTLTGYQGEVPTVSLVTKQARLQGIVVGSHSQQVGLIHNIEARGLRPVVDRTFEFGNLADAVRYEESGAHFGKICLTF